MADDRRPRTVLADDVVTGEAVVVELPVAGPALRALSGGIDVALAIVLLIVATLALRPVLEDLDAAASAAVVILVTVGLFVALPTVCETVFHGRTLGKKIVGLRTVRDDGGVIGFRRALPRHLLGYVEVYLLGGIPALVASIVTSPTRRLGDIAAGTYVARERVDLRLPRPPSMPPHLAAWAAGADIRLPGPLVQRMRAALSQSDQFTVDARDRIARDLEREVLEHVFPPPPASTAPLHLLAAVLAERRRRDAHTLAVQEERRQRLFG